MICVPSCIKGLRKFDIGVFTCQKCLCFIISPWEIDDMAWTFGSTCHIPRQHDYFWVYIRRNFPHIWNPLYKEIWILTSLHVSWLFYRCHITEIDYFCLWEFWLKINSFGDSIPISFWNIWQFEVDFTFLISSLARVERLISNFLQSFPTVL